MQPYAAVFSLDFLRRLVAHALRARSLAASGLIEAAALLANSLRFALGIRLRAFASCETTRARSAGVALAQRAFDSSEAICEMVMGVVLRATAATPTIAFVRIM